MIFANNLQINGYELQQAVVQPLEGFDSLSWKAGMLRFDSRSGVLKLAVGLGESSFEYVLPERNGIISTSLLADLSVTNAKLASYSAESSIFYQGATFVPSSGAVYSHVDEAIALALTATLTYKGVVSPTASQGSITAGMFLESGVARTSLPTAKGWLYRCSGNGYFGTAKVEIGDTVIMNATIPADTGYFLSAPSNKGVGFTVDYQLGTGGTVYETELVAAISQGDLLYAESSGTVHTLYKVVNGNKTAVSGSVVSTAATPDFTLLEDVLPQNLFDITQTNTDLSGYIQYDATNGAMIFNSEDGNLGEFKFYGNVNPAGSGSCYLGDSSKGWAAIYGDTIYEGGTALSDKYSPLSHASSATTHGIGTTAAYGHLKLGAADQNGATATDGICAPNGHTHSQYYYSGNCNNTTTDWTANNITAAGTLRLTGHIVATGGLNLSANGETAESRMYLGYNVFRPWTSDSGKIDLGASAAKWRDLYLSGTLYCGGDIQLDNAKALVKLCDNNTNMLVGYTTNWQNLACLTYNPLNSAFYMTAGNFGIGGVNDTWKFYVNGNSFLGGTISGVTVIDGLLSFETDDGEVTVSGSLFANSLVVKGSGTASDAYINNNNGMLEIDHVDGNGSLMLEHLYPGNGGTSIEVHGNILPDTDSTRNIGSDSSRFQNVYSDSLWLTKGIATGLSFGTNGCSEGFIALDADGYMQFGIASGYIFDSEIKAWDGDLNYYDIYCESLHQQSDERRKNIQAERHLSLDEINSLRSVLFTYKGQTKVKVGTIAQDVLKVLPEVVAEDSKGFYSLDYGALATVLALSLGKVSQSQEERIAALESQMEVLKKEINN